MLAEVGLKEVKMEGGEKEREKELFLEGETNPYRIRFDLHVLF